MAEETALGGRQQKPAWVWYAVLAILVFTVFGRSVFYDFLQWDDRLLILENTKVNPPSAANFKAAWMEPHEFLYIPVTYNLWNLIATASTVEPDLMGVALNPYPFHAANLVMHILCACLVYQLLSLCFRPGWISAAGAALWAVHPIQTEPVVWVTGMKDLLSATLALGAVLIYLRTAKAQRPASAPGAAAGEPPLSAALATARYGLAGVLMLLATFSKPGVIAVPLFAIVIDLLLFRRHWRTVLLCAAPMLVATLPAIIITQNAQPSRAEAPYEAPLWARPLVAGHALAFYVQKIVWPDAFGVDYGMSPDYVLRKWWGYVVWVVPVGLLAAAWFHRAGRHVLLAALALFVAGALPVLGFTPFVFQRCSTVADRYVYLSMVGVALAVVYGLTRLPQRAAMGVAVLLVLAYGARAWVQTQHWRDDETLMSHAVWLNPRSSASYCNAGVAAMLAAGLADRQASLEENTEVQQRLLELRNRHVQRGLEAYYKAVEADPKNIIAIGNLAIFETFHGDMRRALRYLEECLELVDANPWLVPGPGIDRLNVAKICMNIGDYGRAQMHLRLYLQKRPGDRQATAMLRRVQQAMEQAATRPATQPTTATSTPSTTSTAPATTPTLR
jgi:hypothetical protein